MWWYLLKTVGFALVLLSVRFGLQAIDRNNKLRVGKEWADGISVEHYRFAVRNLFFSLCALLVVIFALKWEYHPLPLHSGLVIVHMLFAIPLLLLTLLLCLLTIKSEGDMRFCRGVLVADFFCYVIAMSTGVIMLGILTRPL